jgi:hypothetical protein
MDECLKVAAFNDDAFSALDFSFTFVAETAEVSQVSLLSEDIVLVSTQGFPYHFGGRAMTTGGNLLAKESVMVLGDRDGSGDCWHGWAPFWAGDYHPC